MKKISFNVFNVAVALILATSASMLCGLGVAAYASTADYSPEINTCSMAREYEAQHVGQFDGAFFSSRGVVDNIYYGTGSNDGVYYLIYDDVDAGMYYEAIKVSEATYNTVVACLEQGNEICGTLVGTRDYETIVYELQIVD